MKQIHFTLGDVESSGVCKIIGTTLRDFDLRFDVSHRPKIIYPPSGIWSMGNGFWINLHHYLHSSYCLVSDYQNARTNVIKLVLNHKGLREVQGFDNLWLEKYQEYSIHPWEDAIRVVCIDLEKKNRQARDVLKSDIYSILSTYSSSGVDQFLADYNKGLSKLKSLKQDIESEQRGYSQYNIGDEYYLP